jgi:hypothetical protein
MYNALCVSKKQLLIIFRDAIVCKEVRMQLEGRVCSISDIHGSSVTASTTAAATGKTAVEEGVGKKREC